MANSIKDSSRTTNIVVIGGSYGGIACINTLQRKMPKDSNITITLIESRDARYHCVGSYRALVQKEFAKNIWIPYTNLFPKDSPHKIVRGHVQHVLHDHVLLEETAGSPQRIDFDFLVIATGSMIPAPAKLRVRSSTEGIRVMDKTREDVEQSSKIVVVGGGACGVELAGELKYAYPTKSVTLIHDMPHLVDYPNFPQSFKDEAQRYLEKQGVEVILNEQAEIDGLSRENSVQRADRTVTFKKSDRTIQSDLQFFSIGMQVDTSIISTLRPADPEAKDSFDVQTILVPKTRAIRVRPTLQLDHDAFPHIFAIGDISNADPVPTCMAAVAAGETCARNLLKLVDSLHGDDKQGHHCRSRDALEDYVPIRAQMVLAMNPTGGVSHLPIVGTWFGSAAAYLIKSGDLFTGRFWREMNMPRP
ncbi:Apoptosis-inducing factor 2 [Haplosporangium sp. Z 767]|nr:Apoptosis-inducing factor 2 [Haplosporangium sp. Z 767]KAF9196197.1 Apoptosis-inducing factor 2 [Haplosporangium sp. Z 11]